MKIIFWYNLHNTQNKYNDFNNYFVTKAIFLEENLKTQIAEVRDLMHGALVEKKLEEQHPDPRPDRFKKGDVLRKEGDKKVAKIGDAVRTRLWSARSMDAIHSEQKKP